MKMDEPMRLRGGGEGEVSWPDAQQRWPEWRELTDNTQAVCCGLCAGLCCFECLDCCC